MKTFKEFVAELSTNTLQNYIMKAEVDHDKKAAAIRTAKSPEEKTQLLKKREHRRKGVAHAVDKMVVKTSVQGWSKA